MSKAFLIMYFIVVLRQMYTGVNNENRHSKIVFIYLCLDASKCCVFGICNTAGLITEQII